LPEEDQQQSSSVRSKEGYFSIGGRSSDHLRNFDADERGSQANARESGQQAEKKASLKKPK